MSVLIAADFEDADWDAWWPALTAALPHERLVRSIAEAAGDAIDIALVANPPAGALQGLNSLRLIQSLWAGVDKLLADPTVPPGVPLARMVDPAMNAAMAETALWAVLGLQRDFFDYAASQRAAQWKPMPQRRASDLTVAVLGQGQMGRAVARRLVQHGCRVIGWSTRPCEVDGVQTHAGDAAWPAVLAMAQIVVNLLPLTPATRGVLNAAAFAQMPRGASLVNLARGAHVVEADLRAALDAGHLHRAVLDVFAAEPLPAAHPYWSHPRVTVLPHIAAQTDPRSAAAVVAANVEACRSGLPLAHLVDRVRGY
ncbi:MAG: glyoxylate/hydroxypyruvate reductase A [Burkholderiales bacterium PBB1]|nr:MAG: glyoxylate/hydroxypyruvate reductase A [Burkholderiales bacterium PBB1]